MFSDMLKNDYIPSSGHPGFQWPPETKNHWMILFIVLNIFTAGYYYFIEYNGRKYD